MSKAIQSLGLTPPLPSLLSPRETASHSELRINNTAQRLMASLDLSNGGTLDNEITPPGETAKIETVAQRTGVVSFPNVGKEVLVAGMNKEGQIIGKQIELTNAMESLQKELDSIHQFSQLLTKLPYNKDSHEITPEIKEAAAKLKEIGIDILSADEKSLSNEKIAMIRADLDAGQSKRNNQLHSHLSKFQSTNSEHGSLIDSLRTIERALSRLISSIISNSIKK